MRTLKQLQAQLDRALKNALEEAKETDLLKLPNSERIRWSAHRLCHAAYVTFYNGLSDAEIKKYRVRHPINVSSEELFYNRS